MERPQQRLGLREASGAIRGLGPPIGQLGLGLLGESVAGCFGGPAQFLPTLLPRQHTALEQQGTAQQLGLVASAFEPLQQPGLRGRDTGPPGYLRQK